MSEGNKGKGGKRESFIEVEAEKKEFFESRRLKVEKIEEKRENTWFEVLEERDRERQKRERWERIRRSQYNK